jgi:UDP-glucose 4-epimerase
MPGVLVTSATTSLGARLVNALIESGHSVLAVGAERDPPSTLVRRFDKLHYEHADLTRSRDVRRLLFGPAKALGIDGIVHTALHRSASDEGSRVHALNVESTRELLYLAERHPTIRRFMFRSHGDVYRVDPRGSSLLAEEDPLELSASSPQRVRDRVEADLTVCTRMGLSHLNISVLRCAEVLAKGIGSQLYDYLSSTVCLRPLGYDPMLNLMTIEDAVQAMIKALASNANGVFNAPGADTLPLSLAVKLWGRRALPLPGPLLAPLYRVRASALGMEFRYDMNHRRFHFSAILDGARAREVLGYEPRHPIEWPRTGGLEIDARSRPALFAS